MDCEDRHVMFSSICFGNFSETLEGLIPKMCIFRGYDFLNAKWVTPSPPGNFFQIMYSWHFLEQ